VRYIRTIKKWLQDNTSLIVILISLGIGFGIGLATYDVARQSFVNIGAMISVISALVGIGGMFRLYFKDKREEKKTPVLVLGEPYRRDDGSYFLNVRKARGQGAAQRCVGFITVEFSSIENSATVWEHSALREYNIGTHMGLRLFKIEENSILFPAALGHEISGYVENRRPLDMFQHKRIMVEVSFFNGDNPDPYTDTISKIINKAS
jgi:uncharacterized membrane protein YuzA (DUF378 family)